MRPECLTPPRKLGWHARSDWGDGVRSVAQPAPVRPAGFAPAPSSWTQRSPYGLAPGFDTFASTSQLRFEPFDHQLRAATVALRQMAGRAILADEVGLGKTIEAGIVLSELRPRDLAPQVLVVVPAGLVGQWREELERKFGLPSVVASRQGWEPATEQQPLVDSPVVVASLPSTAARAAPRAPHPPGMGPGDRRRGPPGAQPTYCFVQARPRPAGSFLAVADGHPPRRTVWTTSTISCLWSARVTWVPFPSSAASTEGSCRGSGPRVRREPHAPQKPSQTCAGSCAA